MKIAVLFTVPVFAIAMVEMMPNNPLTKIMAIEKWNWVQPILTLPVVFYSCWMFFVRAWKSTAPHPQQHKCNMPRNKLIQL